MNNKTTFTKRKNVLAAMVGLFAATGVAQQAYGQDGEAATAQGRIDEIIVTASRRAESLNDAALSVAAIDSKEIERKGLAGMEDYLATIPGVSFLDRGVGQNNFVIRGVTADPQGEGQRAGPSVGIYFGEVPLAGLGIGGGAANIRLVDMERIEVLRGPQGTLFGAGSLSGVVRNIPVSPDLRDLEGRVKVGYSRMAEEGGRNNKVEGAINIPLIEDVLGVRAVAYRHDESGYIKNNRASDPAFSTFLASFGVGTITDQEDVGNVEYTGGRIAALWKPIDKLNINLMYVKQKADQEGFPEAQLNTGGYTQTRVPFGGLTVQSPLQSTAVNIGSGEALDEDLTITNLVLEYDFGWASLLSSSSWIEQDNLLARDISSFFAAPVVQNVPTNTESFVQEVRLVSDMDGPFQYLLGAYYEEQDQDFPSYISFVGDLALSPFGTPLGATNALFSDEFFELSLTQKAFYAELSYDITDQLKVTVGGRRYDYERDRFYLVTGLFDPTGANLAAGGQKSAADASGTTYKANASYHLNDNNMFYAQWAEGFRPGGTNNPAPATLCDVNNDGILDGTNVSIRDFFDSDTLESYEFGAKSTLLEGRLQVNAAIYRNNWEGIPIDVQSPTCLFTQVGNAGEAKTQGFEIETTFNVTHALQLIAGGSYVDAELTSDAASLGGQSGDRLPGSPDYSVNVGLQYEFEIAGHSTYIRSDYAYVSGFHNNLAEQGPEAGDYGKLNVKAGMNFKDFYVEAFGHNLTNEDAITWLGTFLIDSRVNRLRPRTIGLNVGYQF